MGKGVTQGCNAVYMESMAQLGREITGDSLTLPENRPVHMQFIY